MSDEAFVVFTFIGLMSLLLMVPRTWVAIRDARRDARRAREYGQHGITEFPVGRTPQPETDVPNRAEAEDGFVDERPGPVEPPEDLALPPGPSSHR